MSFREKELAPTVAETTGGNVARWNRRTWCGVMTVLLALLFAVPPTRAQNTNDYVPDEVLVGLRKAMPRRDSTLMYSGIARRSAIPADPMSFRAPDVGVPVRAIDAIGVVRLRLNPGVSVARAIAALSQRPDVRFAEPNYIVRIEATPWDSKYNAYQYGPQKVQADKAWDIWQPKARVLIAVIDTGVDDTHEDLAAKMFRDDNGNVIGYNAITDTANARDDNGHGSHCAGVAAADTNNRAGIAGIAGWNPNLPNAQDNIRILPVKVLDRSGSGSAYDVASGITWATQKGTKVISMSLGSPYNSDTIATAVQNAIAKDVVVVAAAGNDGGPWTNYPAAYPGVISVGATDQNDKMTSFSTYGSWVKTVAPGNQIYSTYNGGYRTLSGTSMACPHVAGEAALICSHNPTLTASQVSDLITTNVDPYTPYLPGQGIAPNGGRINVYKALLRATVAPKIAGLSLSPSTVPAGLPMQGTLTLDGIAPAGGVTIALSSNNGAVIPPATVTVPEGEYSTTFPILTGPGQYQSSITVTASYLGVTKTAICVVFPPVLTTVSLTPNPVAGGNTVTGTVSLSGVNTYSPKTVLLAYNQNLALVSPPTSVTIPAGAKMATFTLTTRPNKGPQDIIVQASYDGNVVATTCRVNPASVSGISLNPDRIVSSMTSTGTVMLDGPAYAGGVVVTLTSSNPNAAMVPASVTISPNARSATFPIQAQSVGASTSVTITATGNGMTKTASLTVLPPVLSTFTIAPAIVRGGSTTFGTIILNTNTITDTTIKLTSGDSLATFPATVTIRAGSKSATFPISTVRQGLRIRTTSLKATLGDTNLAASLTITP